VRAKDFWVWEFVGAFGNSSTKSKAIIKPILVRVEIKRDMVFITSVVSESCTSGACPWREYISRPDLIRRLDV
jgi:hypothetical protein